MSGNGAKYIVTELVVEQNTISSAGELNSGGGHPSGSMTALCKMEKGDHAWIRTTGVTSTHVLYSQDNHVFVYIMKSSNRSPLRPTVLY